MKRSKSIRALVLGLSFVASSQSALADDEAYRFNVAETDAVTALNTLALQSELSLLFDFNQVKSIKVNALSGTYTLQEALDLMLQDTGLTGSLSKSEVIKISLKSKSVTHPKESEMKLNGTKKNFLSGTSLALLATGMSIPAYAQTSNPEVSSRAIAQVPPVAAQAPAQDGVLDEVIVTAGKRTENVQDAPVSISVLDSEMLKDLGLENGSDIAQMVSGVQMQEVSGFRSQFKIRGIGANDHNISTSPSVAVAIDDVYYSTNAQGSPQMFDIERVEVLKGPQGDLSGVQASGGVVSFVTRKPTFERDGYVKASYGNYNLINVEGAYGDSISDNLAYRVSGKYLQRDGLFDNVSTNPAYPAYSGDLGHTDHTAARLHMLWSANEDTEVLFNVHWSRDAGSQPAPHFVGSAGAGCNNVNIDENRYNPNCIGFAQGLVPHHPPEGEFTTSVGVDSPQDINAEFWGGYVNISHELPFATLTSISSYEAFDQELSFDFDGQTQSAINLARDQEYKGFSQEVRLNGRTDKLDWIVGGTVSYEKLNPNVLEYCGNIIQSNPPLADCNYPGVFRYTNVAAEAANPPSGERNLGESEYQKDTKSYALFGNVKYAITDALMLTLGLRYSDMTVDYEGFGRYYWSDGSVFYNNQGGIGEAIGGSSFDTNNISGRASLSWNATDDTMLYATYSTGFKAGGFDGAIASNITRFLNSYEDETISMVEAGFKSNLTDSIRLNGAIYSLGYNDMQARTVATVYDSFGNSFNTRFLNNLEEARIKGAEVELEWQPTDNLYFTANANFLDTEITESRQLMIGGQTLQDSYDGNELAISSPFTASFYGRYDIPLANGWNSYIQANASYTDEFYHSVENVPLLLEDDFWKADSRIGLTSDKSNWSAAVWVKNIANKEYGVNGVGGNFRGTSIYLGAPRTFGVDINYSF